MDNTLLTTTQALEYLASSGLVISHSTLCNHIRDKILPAIRPGKRKYFISKDDLDAYKRGDKK